MARHPSGFRYCFIIPSTAFRRLRNKARSLTVQDRSVSSEMYLRSTIASRSYRRRQPEPDRRRPMPRSGHQQIREISTADTAAGTVTFTIRRLCPPVPQPTRGHPHPTQPAISPSTSHRNLPMRRPYLSSRSFKLSRLVACSNRSPRYT